LVDHVLGRDLQSWHPNLSSNDEYWGQLSAKPPFSGVKPEDLECQAILLLSGLLRISASNLPSRLPNRSQPVTDFSPAQNMSLYSEIFEVTDYTPRPIGRYDLSIMVESLGRSGRVVQTPIGVQHWGVWLTKHLPIDYRADNLVRESRTFTSIQVLTRKETLRPYTGYR